MIRSTIRTISSGQKLFREVLEYTQRLDHPVFVKDFTFFSSFFVSHVICMIQQNKK